MAVLRCGSVTCTLYLVLVITRMPAVWQFAKASGLLRKLQPEVLFQPLSLDSRPCWQAACGRWTLMDTFHCWDKPPCCPVSPRHTGDRLVTRHQAALLRHEGHDDPILGYIAVVGSNLMSSYLSMRKGVVAFRSK